MPVDLASMVRILGRLKPSVVIPMHRSGRASPRAFALGMPDARPIARSGEASLRKLFGRPTVVVLQPRSLDQQ